MSDYTVFGSYIAEALCCCLLVNHVVYITMTSLLWLRIPIHPHNIKFLYYFLFELRVSNEKKKKKKRT